MGVLILFVNGAGERGYEWAMPLLAQSSLLILVLAAFDLLLRRRPRSALRYALWTLVLLKLALPPFLASPTSPAFWWSPPKGNASEVPLGQQIDVEQASSIALLPPQVSSFPLASIPIPEKPALNAHGFLFSAWLMGVVGLGTWLARRTCFIRRLIKDASAAESESREILERGACDFGLRRPARLRITEGISSPVVCGLLRPVILLPKALAASLTPVQLRAVLLHEIAHVKRGDLWVSTAQALLQVIYWWHPFLWFANAHIRRLREEAVDELTMAHLGSDQAVYPATLLEVARSAMTQGVPRLGLLGIAEPKSVLAERIRHLLAGPLPRRASLGTGGWITFAICALVLLPMGLRHPDARADVPSAAQAVAILYDPANSYLGGKPDFVLTRDETVSFLKESGGPTNLTLDGAVQLLRRKQYKPGGTIGFDESFLAAFGESSTTTIEAASLVLAGREKWVRGVMVPSQQNLSPRQPGLGSVTNAAKGKLLNHGLRPLAQQEQRPDEALRWLTAHYGEDQQDIQASMARQMRSQLRLDRRTFHVDPEIFRKNLKARRSETLLPEPENEYQIFLALWKSASVDPLPAIYGTSMFSSDGTITLWSTPESFAAAERLILELNQPDNKRSSYVRTAAGHLPSVTTEARFLALTDAEFESLQLGPTDSVRGAQVGSVRSIPGHARKEFEQRLAELRNAQKLTSLRITSNPGVLAKAGTYSGGKTGRSVELELVAYLTSGRMELTVVAHTEGQFSPSGEADWPNARGWTNVAAFAQVMVPGDGCIVLRKRHDKGEPRDNLLIVLVAELTPPPDK